MDDAPSPIARRRRRSSVEIRALIMAAARVEFSLNGLSSATTRAIADRAGVAEHLIFRNFGSKANLFEEAVLQPFTRDFASFVDSLDLNKEEIDIRHHMVVRKVYKFLKENSSFLHALVRSADQAEGKIAHALDEYFSIFERRLSIVYDDTPTGFDVHPRLLVRYAFGMVASAVLLNSWFFPEAPVDEETAATALTRMTLKAVQPAGSLAMTALLGSELID